MPKSYKCKGCGEKVFKVSVRGFCRTCSITRSQAAASQISARRGPLYEKWVKGMQDAMKRSSQEGK